jgi:hypothetical protein
MYAGLHMCVHIHTPICVYIYRLFCKICAKLKNVIIWVFQAKKCSITTICQFINRYTATSILTFHCAKLLDVSYQ